MTRFFHELRCFEYDRADAARKTDPWVRHWCWFGGRYRYFDPDDRADTIRRAAPISYFRAVKCFCWRCRMLRAASRWWFRAWSLGAYQYYADFRNGGVGKALARLRLHGRLSGYQVIAAWRMGVTCHRRRDRQAAEATQEVNRASGASGGRPGAGCGPDA